MVSPRIATEFDAAGGRETGAPLLTGESVADGFGERALAVDLSECGVEKSVRVLDDGADLTMLRRPTFLGRQIAKLGIHPAKFGNALRPFGGEPQHRGYSLISNMRGIHRACIDVRGPDG